MSRLIDADALLEKMSTHCNMCQYNDHIHHCRRECDWHEAIDEVEDMDEVEIEPVRHGHWEIKEVWSLAFPTIERPFCSLCGGLGSANYLYAYCPYCGAKMDEVSE